MKPLLHSGGFLFLSLPLIVNTLLINRFGTVK